MDTGYYTVLKYIHVLQYVAEEDYYIEHEI